MSKSTVEQLGELGPVQVLLVGFERTDLFTGEVLDELALLEDRGIIRILDLLYVEKTAGGDLVAIEIAGMKKEEAESFGGFVSRLLGLEDPGGSAAGSDSVEGAGESYGLSADQIVMALQGLPAGTAAGVLVFEHIWATNFRDALRRVSGFPIMQGLLTREAMLMVGEEARAMREAAVATEFAKIIEGAALLDATEAVLAAEVIAAAAEEVAAEAVAASEAIRAEAAANAVRALIAAGVIEQYAAAEALDALVQAELIKAEAIGATAPVA